MKITLHIGVPKTGSTAIQAHIGLNRGWFSEHKIAIPETGFSEGYGHVLLFEDRTNEHLEQLQDELDALKLQGYEHAVISWEGLNTFSRERLENIKQHMKGHEVEVVAYLREQSEVVQSGFLQAIKQRRQKRTLDDFLTIDAIITPLHLDYNWILSKYADVFGESNVRARVYEKAALAEQNIVIDFLQVLGVDADARFILAPDAQNISLDVGSAYVLNITDSLFGNLEERDALVDLLLCRVTSEGPDEKYFLSKSHVMHIRAHYAKSNDVVRRKYLETPIGRDTLFAHDHSTYAAQNRLEQLGGEKLSFLSAMKAYRSWSGQDLVGSDLQVIASPVRGWSIPELAGLWTRGEKSSVCFRVMPTKISPHARTLKLKLEGAYFATNEATQVRLPGMAPARKALNTEDIEVPLACIDDYGRIDIQLVHDHPTTPRSIGMNEDDRELAYLIRKASFTIA
ncbi:MAG: hypothetical protein HOC23_18710 [Halieaceae bacterium]|jgi:hypothetical protein|nr:hypothetical protein [Halieaceae bacterium]